MSRGDSQLYDAGPTLTRREVAQQLVERGFRAEDAPRLIAEYIDEASAKAGFRMDDWSLDGADVDAIADSYGWLDRECDESLDDARERAAAAAREYERHAPWADDPEAARQEAARWAQRTRPPAEVVLAAKAAGQPSEHDTGQVIEQDAGQDAERRSAGWETVIEAEHADARVATAAAAMAAVQAAARARADAAGDEAPVAVVVVEDVEPAACDEDGGF